MTELRKGWTTGCCAALAAKAATHALIHGTFPDQISLRLPGGEHPCFPPIKTKSGTGWAECGIIKDAGDDPDVTHGATIISHVKHGKPQQGIQFQGGKGVGKITKPGLPLAIGEPAINPVPRLMIEEAVCEITNQSGHTPDLTITISVLNGELLAKRTWNPRLGIVGGISILGTTGIVRPFSCAAWIASIHRGIDVANAEKLEHIIAATGSRSELAARNRHNLPETSCIDMGDFVGGTLKYLRRHPIPKLTLAGGIAKFTKLALGANDLHSKRSQVDFTSLQDWLGQHGIKANIVKANTVLEVYETIGPAYAKCIATEAKKAACKMLGTKVVNIELLVVDRSGNILAIEEFDQ
ncbi:MAG: cobalt-precorrin-5B (C(1))-methyltransferase [Pseudomonadota bacterium]